ncbi:hypothetical protein BDN71DRAFT_1506362 [Pleurotus eryngii]|uniref:Uncharacterized protein n=1 Tax=Pleurotus eryngii TaxID=5323 RepID=A0A9P5ZY56_PLEER|nr:hypothetical protein BDN71DRAFT_1506362 [Pleurotus eryngii]
MTEYTTSSQAYREYMSSRERTARWVNAHSPTKTRFNSPSVAPSVIDGLLPSSPPSEADSSHSLPPQMVLRFPDGRPDVPIPHDLDASASGPVSRAHTLPQAAGARRPYPDYSPPSGPEEIRILPSRTGQAPPPTSQTRSQSLPRNAYSPSSRPSIQPPPPPPPPPPGAMHRSKPRLPLALPPPIHTPPESAPLPLPAPQPQVTFDPQHIPGSSAWHPYTDKVTNRRQPIKQHGHPPAIIYAPSHHSKSRYAPPAILSHPPPRGPGGVVYSHSIPQYPTPYPSAMSSSHLTSVHEEDVRRGGMSRPRHDRSRSATLADDPHHGHHGRRSSVSSFVSNDSGSTYYVLPSGRQKVHIIAPEPSIYTATSTTKSPSSPKRPFFKRLFGFNKEKLTSDSSKISTRGGGGKRLVRRHSTGGSGRGRPVTPREPQP